MSNSHKNFEANLLKIQEDDTIISASSRHCGFSNGATSSCCPPPYPDPPSCPIMPFPPDFMQESVFGEMYNNESQSITLTAGVEATIGLAENLPNNNVTYGTNSITITRPGVYLISFMTMLQATGESAMNIQVFIRLNGNIIPSSTLGIALGTDFEILKLATLVPLTPGDILTLGIKSVEAGTVLFSSDVNSNLMILRIN